MENIFTVKSIVAQELAEVYGYIENRIKDYNTKYDVVEILDEQETHWKTGEPLWEDAEHTIPQRKKRYDYVPKMDADYTSEDLVRIDTLRRVQKLLEKAM